MKLENVVAISTLPGLYKLVASRNNGLLVENFDTGKTKFCSVRKFQFTPLETVSIYTSTDTTPVIDVIKIMLDKPPIDLKSSSKDLIAYFETVLPDFDRDRVHISDIKKLIKWYNFLDERKMLTPEAFISSRDEEE